MSLLDLSQLPTVYSSEYLSMFSWGPEILKEKGAAKMTALVLSFLNSKQWEDPKRLATDGRDWADWTFSIEGAYESELPKLKGLSAAIAMMRVKLLMMSDSASAISKAISSQLEMRRFEPLVRAVLVRNLSILNRWVSFHSAKVGLACVQALKGLKHLKAEGGVGSGLGRTMAFKVSEKLGKALKVETTIHLCRQLKGREKAVGVGLVYKDWLFPMDQGLKLRSIAPRKSLEEAVVRLNYLIRQKPEDLSNQELMNLLELSRASAESNSPPKGLLEFRRNAVAYMSPRILPLKYKCWLECLTKEERMAFLDSKIASNPEVVNQLIYRGALEHVLSYFYFKGEVKVSKQGIVHIDEALATILNDSSARNLTREFEAKGVRAGQVGERVPVPWQLIAKRTGEKDRNLSGMGHWYPVSVFKDKKNAEQALKDGAYIFRWLGSLPQTKLTGEWMDTWTKERAEVLQLNKTNEPKGFEIFHKFLLPEELKEWRAEYYQDKLDELLLDLRSDCKGAGLGRVVLDQGLVREEEMEPESFPGLDLRAWELAEQLDLKQVSNLMYAGAYHYARLPGTACPISVDHLLNGKSLEGLKDDSQLVLSEGVQSYSEAFLGQVAPKLLRALQDPDHMGIRKAVLSLMIQQCYFSHAPFPEGVTDLEMIQACEILGLDGSEPIADGLRYRYWASLRSQYEDWEEQAFSPEDVTSLLGTPLAFAQVPWCSEKGPEIPLRIAAWMGDPLFLTHLERVWGLRERDEEKVVEAWKILDRAFYPIDRAYDGIPHNLYDDRLASGGREGYRAKLQGVFERANARNRPQFTFRQSCYKFWLSQR